MGRGSKVSYSCAECGTVFFRYEMRRRYCSRKCTSVGLRKEANTPEAVSERFWSKVDRTGGEDACWPWLAACNAAGYGLFMLDGHTRLAHRVGFELYYGVALENLGCHTCDNPPCCNPRHLYDGTVQDNVRDSWEHGRSKHFSAAGELQNKRRRFTADEILELRRRYAAGEGYCDLAREVGTRANHMWDIVHGRLYSRVGAE